MRDGDRTRLWMQCGEMVLKEVRRGLQNWELEVAVIGFRE